MLGLNPAPWNSPVVPAYGLNTAWASAGINTSNGLPDSGMQFPPRPFDVAQKQFHVWSSWWTSDIAELQNIYIQRNRVRPTAFAGGLVGRLQRFFWGRPNIQSNPRLHVPAASDLSRTSADLLFGEPWTITPGVKETANVVAAGDRLQLVFGDDLTITTMLEHAEMSSALGGAYLRLWWDESIADHVMMDAIPADAAVPEWKYNTLAGVTFWRIIANSNGTWLRHLERHVPGRIIHGLYEGDQGQLGRRIPLAAATETEWLAKVADSDGGLDTGVDGLTAAYIPNARPNRVWRNTPGLTQLGRSDYDGLEALFDALDEAYSSWMRDIDLGKARLFVDESMLQSEGPGSGAVFDGEQEIFTKLKGLGSMVSGAQGIEANQFSIRWLEHSQTCAELLNCILRGAGISTGSFSDSSLTVGVPTATEVRSRDNLSERTRAKKINLYKAYSGPLMRTGMQIDANLFSGNWALTDLPSIEFPARSMQSPQELAQTLNLLAMAKAISTEQMVTELHPFWTADEIAAEVERIKDEAKSAGVVFDGDQPPAGRPSPFPQPNQDDDQQDNDSEQSGPDAESDGGAS